MSERNKRKSPFSTTALSFVAFSPANPREYPYKSYLARNHDPYATFVAADSVEQFHPKSSNANTLDAEPETDFNAKRPFKVIQGHLFRCH